MSGCGGDIISETILDEILEGKRITLPTVDFDGPEFQIPVVTPVVIDPLTNDDLTTRQVNGAGTFDALMQSIANHLKAEYTANRISGAEYTKAYIAAVQSAMGTAAQFLLGRDQAYWQSVLAQAQAQTAQVQLVTARVQLETAKLQYSLAHYEALNAEATYALTTMKIGTEDQTYCNLKAQELLIKEQMEVQRSQTMNTRSDGITTVTGTVGKQKDLYTQQITSYQRDSEVKAGKFWVDAWITQKTIDEGLVPPTQFTNAIVDDVLETIKTNNQL